MTGKDIEKLSVSKQLLLDYADYSPKEIEEKTGIPALRAAQELVELLEDRDWLTIKQKEQVLLHRMEDTIRNAEQRLETVTEDNYAPTLNAVLRGYTNVAKQLEAARKNVDIDISEITRAQARTFGGAYDYAWDVAITILRETHPDITDDEVRAAKKESMEAVKRKLRESVPNDRD